MSKLFRRNSTVSCFFCNSSITPLPRNPRSFRCPHCDCWNRYDTSGEIISDEPSMHDENLNAKSFAKRGTLNYTCMLWHVNQVQVASPRKDRLPTMYSSTLFCHTCQTNQMLLANLLSNYLPPPDVRASLHSARPHPSLMLCSFVLFGRIFGLHDCCVVMPAGP